MATAEELCESEVLWPEAPLGDDALAPAPPSCSSPSVAPDRRGVPEKARHHQGSRPVGHSWPGPARSARRGGGDEDGHDGGRSGSVVPPHVLVSRRRSEGAVAVFALRSGPGRARKLSHLRDSVLRMTGFIEG